VSLRPDDLAAKPVARRYIAPNPKPKEQLMRKPRDYDSELKALAEKAKALKAKKVLQLGELAIATGADSFDPEVLTGALLALVENKEDSKKESWRKRGQAFFRSERHGTAQSTASNSQGDQASEGHAASR
jgi:DNA-binding protein H-NS